MAYLMITGQLKKKMREEQMREKQEHAKPKNITTVAKGNNSSIAKRIKMVIIEQQE